MSETEIKSGPAKGMVSQNKMSDYQDVNGLMFPFTMSQGAKGQPGGFTLTASKVEINVKIDDKDFAYPTEN
jgi:hypothetical protein